MITSVGNIEPAIIYSSADLSDNRKYQFLFNKRTGKIRYVEVSGALKAPKK